MSIKPPQRNLGAGEDWGRWVERQIKDLSTSSLQSEMGNQRSFMNNNATLKQLSNQLVDLQGVVSALPIPNIYHLTSEDWSVPANATTTIASQLVPWVPGKSVCDIIAIASGWYDSYNPSMIPMAYRATFRININGDNSPILPLIAQNMDTYVFVGSYSSRVSSNSDIEVKFNAINPSTYVASQTDLNSLNFDILTIFS